MDEIDYRPSFRLDRSYTAASEWWIPEKPLYRVPGKLTYSPEIGLIVELGRFLMPAYGRPEPRTLHGKLQFGGDATLFDAQPTNWVSYGAHVSTQTIAARALIAGGTVESLNSAVLGIELQLDGLNEWASPGPFHSVGADEGDGEGTRLQYHYEVDMHPSPSFEVASIGAKIAIRASCEEREVGHSITLTHAHFLSLHYNGPIPIRKAIEHAHNLELLFTLLTGAPSKIHTFKVSLERQPEFSPRDSHLLYRRAKLAAGRRLFHRLQMPAAYEHASEGFGRILSQWFSVCERFAPVTKLIAASIFQTESPFLEQRFITLAQAIEGYCRISQKEKYLPDDRFGPIRREMIKSLPNDDEHFQRVAASRLAFLNDFTLRDRLLSLLDRHKWLLLELRDEENPKPSRELGVKFADKVKTLRNALTHVESGKSKSVAVDFPTIYKLRSVLCMLLLYESGIDIESRYREVAAKDFPTMWWIDWPSSP